MDETILEVTEDIAVLRLLKKKRINIRVLFDAKTVAQYNYIESSDLNDDEFTTLKDWQGRLL